MKTTLLILAAAALLASCGGNTQKKAADTAVTETVDMHTAQNSLDLQGTYKGTLPAADCPGIAATLVLKADGTYDLNYTYLERDSSFDEKGAYAVDGNILVLTPAEGESFGYYKVEENALRQLDGDKQVIKGPLAESFVLKKEVK